MISFIKIAANLSYNDYNLFTRGSSKFVMYNKSPFERFKGLGRLIYRVHNSNKLNNICKLPWLGIWNRMILDRTCTETAKKSKRVCFMFDGSAYRFVRCGYVQYLRKHFKDCYVVFYLDGKIDIFNQEYKLFSVEKLKQEFDLVITYNDIDANRFGLKMDKLKTVMFNVGELNAREVTDVFFVGAAKDRLSKILYVYEKLTEKGLNCDFHITDVVEEKQKYADKISYNKRLGYKEVLERVAATKCVVNILEGGNAGITLRDWEAIWFGKLLLTDNDSIRNTEIYEEKNVIFIDWLENAIPKIICCDLPIVWECKNKLGEEQYLSWLLEELDKVRK